MRHPLLLILLSVSAAPVLWAQPDERPGVDAAVGSLDRVASLGREGAFPFGQNGLVIASTLCNRGSEDIAVLAPMDPDHPITAFLVAREVGGRFVQISDRSFVFHHFFALGGDECGSCQNRGNGTSLNVGCSDEQGTAVWGDPFWLGDPSEVDPWSGRWEPVCSQFDRGEPPVAPPEDCDGLRSPIGDLGPLGHRIRVGDEELAVASARFFFQVHEVILGEPEETRGDNLASREWVPLWNGAQWVFVDPQGGGGFREGSILNQWDGAFVASSTSEDDGRVYVGTNVVDLGDGYFRYEFAVHNRDHGGGIGSFFVPVCPRSDVRLIEFGDLDDDPANDWQASRDDRGLRFESFAHPLFWNSIFNFSLEVDAPPRLDGEVTLRGSLDDPSDEFSVESRTPTRPMNLEVQPEQALPGETLELRLAYGGIQEPFLLAVVTLNGTPTFTLVTIDRFDHEGSWDTDVVVPGGLSGVSLELQGFGVSECGTPTASEEILLQFL